MRHPRGLRPPKPFVLACGQLYKMVGMIIRVILLTLSPSHPPFWEHVTTNKEGLRCKANPILQSTRHFLEEADGEAGRAGGKKNLLVSDSEITACRQKAPRGIAGGDHLRHFTGFLSKDSTSLQKRTNAMSVSEPSLGLEKQISSLAYREVTNYYNIVLQLLNSQDRGSTQVSRAGEGWCIWPSRNTYDLQRHRIPLSVKHPKDGICFLIFILQT